MAQPGRRVALIVNPTSGGGRGERVLGEALPLFRGLGVDPEVYVTASGSEPAGLARRLAGSDVELVVAVGGDGHAAAVGEGLVGSKTPMAVLPAGSANDYARTIRMPVRNVRAAVKAVLDGALE